MKKRWLAVLLAALVLPVFGGSPVRGVIEFDREWQVKPAENPDSPPQDGDWGSCRVVALERFQSNIKSQDTSWSKTPRKTIHRLWYRYRTAVPADWRGRAALLEFDRIDGDAIVFVNGKRIGEVLNPTGTIELTGLKYGEENVIDVYLARDYTGISRPFERDYMNYAARGPQGRNLPMERWPFGLTAPVRLRGVPKSVRIDSAAVKTSVKNKTLTLDLDLFSDRNAEIAAEAEIFDRENRKVLTVKGEGHLSAAAGAQTVAISGKWADPRLWELEDGYCYTAVISLFDRATGALLDRLEPVRFGFRELETAGNRVLLNGHPVRFRMHSVGNDSLDELLGVNTVEVQPNATMFYCDWFVWSHYSPEWFERLDEKGIFCLMPVPSVSNARAMFLESEPMRREYERQIGLWMKRYRNHPSIIAWVPSMNVIGSHANIHADGMGDRSKQGSSAANRMVQQALDIVKKHDPTRLTFAHGDGAIGDIASANMYLNLVPLQEREEWPSDWAAKNEMPYMAVEFGQPCTINYWKGPRFILTEYMAIYLGQKAYTTESAEGLKKLVPTPIRNMYVNWFSVDPAHYPAFFEFEGLFMRNTNRAWRTWGVTGWFNWDFDIGFGLPPGRKPKAFGHYNNWKEVFPRRPEWANARFDYIAETSSPLLAYIAGAPTHTDKTHSFYSGEEVAKQLSVVWDGPGEAELKLAWQAFAGERKIAGASDDLTLTPGEIRLIPFAFKAPEVAARTGGRIEMTLTRKNGAVITDTLPLEFFPASVSEKKADKVKFQLFDPKQRTARWFDLLNIDYEPVTAGRIDVGRPLVIGREALNGLQTLPFRPEDVKAGLKVLFLAQQPADWESMGFTTVETMPRYVFPRNFTDPLFRGLEPADFVNWRGTPDLLPEKKWARSYNYYRAPKWTNTHAVASAAIEIPGVAGIESLINCEFDLKYSALLRARYGKGALYYSTLEFDANVGRDPAATVFAGRLLDQLASPHDEAKPVATEGLDELQKRLAAGLWIGDSGASAAPVADSILVAGAKADPQSLLDRAKAGRTVFTLPMEPEQLRKFGFTSVAGEVYRLEPETGSGPAAAVTPDMLRWRDKVTVNRLRGGEEGYHSLWDGILVYGNPGRGRIVHSQLNTLALMTRYPKTEENGKKIWPSVEKSFQLYATLLNSLGAGVGDSVASRLTSLRRGVTYSNLDGWHVCGPFLYPGLKVDGLIGRKVEAEEDAIAGNALADISYYLKDGRRLDWRRTVSADDSGYIDLQKELNSESFSLAYLTRKISCDRPRTATIRLGMDFYLQVYLNGKLVFDASRGGGGAPKINSHRFRVQLEKGDNVITVKIASGSKGFGFYANISDAGESGGETESGETLNFYTEKDTSYDPYQFGYY